MRDVTTKADENALSAHSLHEMALDTTLFIKDNIEKVNKLPVAMHAIEQAALNIKKIIEVIDAIASQTHLLSLNASIEAARLGDQSLGFCVIAKEM